jgi:serine/threonine-protein kinase
MGVVFKARDTLLGRVVALKRIRGGVLAQPDEVERFYREARAAAQLSHPHIVPLYEIDQHQDQLFYTMKLAEGGCLARQRERFTGPARDTVVLVAKVARATQYAHEKGILHRDLKPGNVLLDECGEPLVGDFGLAKFLDADAELTKTGQPVGTPAYMAPEQAAGQAGSAQTDVWSLGVILYELLVGQRPFSAQSTQNLSQQILTSDPPMPRSLRAGLDPALETIVLKCLEKEPSRRFSSARELADELERWLRDEPIRTRPEPWPCKLWRRLERRPGLAIAAIALSVLILATAVLLPGAARPSKPARPEPIELIGPEGFRRGGRWVTGDGTIRAGPSGVLRLEMPKHMTGLVESFPVAPWPRYRFRADIQAVGQDSIVGLYVAYGDQPVPLGREYWFTQLTFSENDLPFDAMLNLKLSRANLELRRLGLLNIPRPYEIDIRRALARPPMFNAANGQWRTLCLEVTPDQVSAYWDWPHGLKGPSGREIPHPFETVPVIPTLRDFTNGLAAAFGQYANPKPPPYRPRGGLGFICQNGTMQVRKAVLEPLAEGN